MNEYYEIPALVLGLSINGLGVIRSLAKDRRIKIIGLGVKNRMALKSRHLSESYEIDSLDSTEQIFDALKEINDSYNKVIVFPTGNDYWVKILLEYKEKLPHLVINYEKNSSLLMKKSYQAEIAEKLGVPYPKSVVVEKTEQLYVIANTLKAPYVVKPIARNTGKEPFRIKMFKDDYELRNTLLKHVDSGYSFIVSEFVPGPDRNLYTYGSYAYRGEVKGSFTGRKLTQIPSTFGVAGTAESLGNIPELEEQSLRLLAGTEFTGISQIEYKYDERDNKYKLMEINPRSWLWIHLSATVDRNLLLCQYYFEALGMECKFSQNNIKNKIFVHGTAVIYDIKNKNSTSFWIMVRSFFRGKTDFAIFSLDDPGPWFKRITNRFGDLKRKISRNIR